MRLNYDKLCLIGNLNKVTTVTIGGSLLATSYPYFTIGVMCFGGVVNEFVEYFKKQALKKSDKKETEIVNINKNEK